MGEISHDDDLMARLERISAGVTQLPCPEPEPPSPELKLIRRLLEVPEEPEPHWGPPLSDAEPAECEQRLGVSLPEDYRAFLTRVTRGGDWPFCLVWEPGEGSSEFGGGLRPDLPDDLGIRPLHDPGTGRPMRFLDWMERAMERCRALLEDGEDLYLLHTFARPPM